MRSKNKSIDPIVIILIVYILISLALTLNWLENIGGIR